jgi:polysaccharide biosynthesis protein PslH
MPPRREAPGAIPIVLHAELTGLQAMHDVTLVTCVGDEPGEAEAAEELRRAGVDIHVVDRRQPHGAARWSRRVRLAAAWLEGSRPWRTVWFAAPQVQSVIDQLARERRFDVVAVEDNSMGGYRLPSRVPSVLTEHEVQPALAARRDGIGLAAHDARRWGRYQPLVWRRFDGVQVFTNGDADAVARTAPDLAARVHVNPFGVELPEPCDPAHEHAGRVLFVGNFTHPPNVDAALWLAREILPRLRDRVADAHLVLVGAAAPEAVTSHAAADVTVVGEAPELRSYLEAAAVVVAPVRTGGGMRMKVLHALAAGKAVVTTTLGTAGLLVGREPAFAVANEAEAVATAVAELLLDPVRRHTLGANGRALVAEQHSPEAYARRLTTVYEEVLART